MAILVVQFDANGELTAIPPAGTNLYLWNTEQSITFVPGNDDTEITSFEFSENWPGSRDPVKIGGRAYTVSAGKPLGRGAGDPEKYWVYVFATHLPTGRKVKHDPDIENHPQP